MTINFHCCCCCFNCTHFPKTFENLHRNWICPRKSCPHTNVSLCLCVFLFVIKQINANDDAFWDQFWSEHCTSIQDVFALVPSSEIRNLRKNNPANLATLCYKATERLMRAVDSSCRTHSEQQAALNCVRLLTRVIPYIHEDAEWKDFFWSSLPSSNENETTTIPLAQSLLNAVCVSCLIRLFRLEHGLIFICFLWIRTCYSARISQWQRPAVPVPTKPKNWPTSIHVNTFGMLVLVLHIRRQKIPNSNNVEPNYWNCCWPVSARPCTVRRAKVKSQTSGLHFLQALKTGMHCHCLHHFWIRFARMIPLGLAFRIITSFFRIQWNRSLKHAFKF